VATETGSEDELATPNLDFTCYDQNTTKIDISNHRRGAMSASQTRTSMPARDNVLRRYVDRHSGFVLGISVGFAVASCLGLVLMFGMYASLGGENGAVITLGLCLWLAFNGWAIRRFIAKLRQRAADENERLRFGRLKPLPQTY
jgi:cytochrome c biogenesis protein CcdA